MITETARAFPENIYTDLQDTISIQIMTILNISITEIKRNRNELWKHWMIFFLKLTLYRLCMKSGALFQTLSNVNMEFAFYNLNEHGKPSRSSLAKRIVCNWYVHAQL